VHRAFFLQFNLLLARRLCFVGMYGNSSNRLMQRIHGRFSSDRDESEPQYSGSSSDAVARGAKTGIDAMGGIAAALPHQAANSGRVSGSDSGQAMGATLLSMIKPKDDAPRQDVPAHGLNEAPHMAGVWELEAGMMTGSANNHLNAIFEEDIENLRQRRSWRLFEQKVKVTSEGWLFIRLTRQNLGDDDMAMLARFLDELLGSGTRGELWTSLELDQNMVEDAGLTMVLDALERGRVSCKHIKLYKNNLSDTGGRRLARMIAGQPEAVKEIHLSHNSFSAVSLVAICMALDFNNAYPLAIQSHGALKSFAPCWVRIEHNCIDRPFEVLDLLYREELILSCTAKNREACGPWRCEHSSRRWEETPPVHLFMIHKQNDFIPVDDEELRNQVAGWKTYLQTQANREWGWPSAENGWPSAENSWPSAENNFENIDARADEGSKKLALDHEGTPDQEEALDREEILKWAAAKVELPLEEVLVTAALHSGAGSAEEYGAAATGEEEFSGADISGEHAELPPAVEPEVVDAVDVEEMEKLRQKEIDDALEIISAIPEPEDKGVFGRWKRHIENADNPRHEAQRILRLMTGLRMQGFFDTVQRRPRMVVPMQMSPSLAASPAPYSAEDVGDGAAQFLEATGRAESQPATPALLPELQPLSSSLVKSLPFDTAMSSTHDFSLQSRFPEREPVEQASSNPEQQGYPSAVLLRDAQQEEETRGSETHHLLGLLQQLQQSEGAESVEHSGNEHVPVLVGASRDDVPPEIAGYDTPGGEESAPVDAKLKKKGKNKIKTSAHQPESSGADPAI